MKFLTALFIAATMFAVPLAAQAGDAPAVRYAHSQPPPNSCVPHDVAEEQLAILFNEKVVGLGLGKNQNTVVELFVSRRGSWTILVNMTNDMSRIATSGENWTASDGLAGLAS